MSPLFDINNKESGQTITTSCEADFGAEKLEKRSFLLLEEFAIVPHVYEEKKVSDASFPSLFVEQQGAFNHVFQDPFLVLLEASEKGVLKICLGLASEYNFLERITFRIGLHFQFALLFRRLCFLPLKKDLPVNQSMVKMLTWLHWIFYFT